MDELIKANPFEGWPGHPRYYELLLQAAEIHAMKNQDYGGQKGDPLSNFKGSTAMGVSPFVGCMVRASDKAARIFNLMRKAIDGIGAAVKGESLIDNLIDLANYALIAVILWEEEHSVAQG